MDAVWVCLMVNKSLDFKDAKNIKKELTCIFHEDLVDFKVGCNDQLSHSGEYYLFVKCLDYWKHTEAIQKNHFVSCVIPSVETPHCFSSKEITSFLSSIGHKETEQATLQNGDVVLVKSGYLKGLYGIIIKMVTVKKYKVFFSFYIRQFYENLPVTELEFIGKVSGYQFSTESISQPVIIGAHVVHHHRKLYRTEGRKSKVKKDRG